jgi:hypothetical protein
MSCITSTRFLRTAKSILFLSMLCGLVCGAYAQEKDSYILGEERKLEIIVYILGEVIKPGEYRVYDNTNIAELLAKAGGATEFANLGSVKITRVISGLQQFKGNSPSPEAFRKKIIKVDIGKYFSNVNAGPLPELEPGDIVYVPSNKWHAWRSAASVMRDLAVIASAYFLYLRANK